MEVMLLSKQKNQINFERFENIYQKYADDIYRVSFYLTRQSPIAKDITKRVFESLYKNWEMVDESYIYSYLVRQVKVYVKEAIQEKSNVEEVIQ